MARKSRGTSTAGTGGGCRPTAAVGASRSSTSTGTCASGSRSSSRQRQSRPKSASKDTSSPRHSSPVNDGICDQWWVLDNGSGTLKSSFGSEFVSLENAIITSSNGRKEGFSDQFEDLSRMHWSRPCEQGFVTDPYQQLVIWKHVQEKLNIKSDCNFLCSSPPNSFEAIDDNLAEIAFEDMACDGFGLISTPEMASFAIENQTTLLIDIGYSATHVCAVNNNTTVPSSVIRMPVGGRVMTNYLKDLVSYRHVNVCQEQHLVEEIKLQTLHVVDDYILALQKARERTPQKNPYMIDYLLPDYVERYHGVIIPREEMDLTVEKPAIGRHVLRLTNETFAPAELLFHPNDIGINSIGLPECVALSILRCPDWMQPALTKNMVLCGGGANIPGLQDRLAKELQEHIPQDFGPATLTTAPMPELLAWRGGCALGKYDPSVKRDYVMTKAEYHEHGKWIQKFRQHDL